MEPVQSLAFRRVEHVSSNGNGSVLIGSFCAFCSFFAVSKDKRAIEMAEAAHNCPGVRRFRELERERVEGRLRNAG